MQKLILFVIVALLTMTMVSCKDDDSNPVSPGLGTIAGTVTDSHGSVLPGVQVSTLPATVTVTSDNSGFYLISDVVPGQYVVIGTLTGFGTDSLTVSVSADNVTTANISMTADAGSITGTVTDDQGGALSNITVTTRPVTQTATTEANGHYTIADIAPRQYWVVAERSGYQTDSVSVTVAANNVATANITLSQLSGMVLIPAGSYQMGASYAGGGQPVHTVNVPAFYMDIYEVTNAQYKAFCDATGRAYPPDPFYYSNYFTNPAYANYPVVHVDWTDAHEYAAWAGKRLPSEAEWELAAKGTSDNRQWPWSDTWVGANANVLNNPADGYDYTAPVGSYPNGISQAGCYDMAGNAYEWCEDDWHDYFNDAPTDGSAWVDSPRNVMRVMRGGSIAYDNLVARCARRNNGGTYYNQYDVGFRCAKDL